ncbi:hypothetical protein ALC57_06181 [Trachymyrmex cornetzi]|uniref:Uncharacterized protein n=1 Tax=Trachymyrmex cornetzi TaxID=471704 RepID=A0A151J919_9HYME|nr:hypothetical protein ALC57_06181 [Trachymyrmex cornetzi]
MSDGEIRRHGPLLPNTIRCIICGPSNCGKTNALIGLIESPHGVRFENVYNDHVNTDISYENFCTLCHLCWQRKYGFVIIDKDSVLRNGRYRRGFNDFAVV